MQRSRSCSDFLYISQDSRCFSTVKKTRSTRIGVLSIHPNFHWLAYYLRPPTPKQIHLFVGVVYLGFSPKLKHIFAKGAEKKTPGWWQLKDFFMFTPKFGEDEPRFPLYDHTFQMGWFHHQLEKVSKHLLMSSSPSLVPWRRRALQKKQSFTDIFFVICLPGHGGYWLEWELQCFKGFLRGGWMTYDV